jgi:hypothetical protein
MLGWFAQDERWLLRFKFLDRFEGISATLVREAFNSSDIIVEKLVPPFVYNYRNEIREYLKEAKDV